MADGAARRGRARDARRPPARSRTSRSCCRRRRTSASGSARSSGWAARSAAATGRRTRSSTPGSTRRRRQIVVDSGVPFTLVGLHLTHQALATPEVVERIRGGRRGARRTSPPTGSASSARRYREIWGFDAPLHDPVALALALDPSLATFQEAFVAIETRGPLDARRDRRRPVRPARPAPPNARVPIELDVERFWDMLVRRSTRWRGSAMIAVVGSVNLDIVVGVERHPAPGETVLGGDRSDLPGGKGANQAVAAARLGQRRGDRRPGRGRRGGDALLAALRAEAVDVDHLRDDPDAPTGRRADHRRRRPARTPSSSAPAPTRASAPRTSEAAPDVLADAGRRRCCSSRSRPTRSRRRALPRAARVVLNPAPARAVGAELLAASTCSCRTAASSALLAGAPEPRRRGATAVALARRVARRGRRRHARRRGRARRRARRRRGPRSRAAGRGRRHDRRRRRVLRRPGRRPGPRRGARRGGALGRRAAALSVACRARRRGCRRRSRCLGPDAAGGARTGGARRRRDGARGLLRVVPGRARGPPGRRSSTEEATSGLLALSVGAGVWRSSSAGRPGCRPPWRGRRRAPRCSSRQARPTAGSRRRSARSSCAGRSSS